VDPSAVLGLAAEDPPQRGRSRSSRQRLKHQRAPALFLAGTDEAVAARYHGALHRVERLRGDHPDWDDDRVAEHLVTRYLAEVTLSGAAAGGAAAMPGVGLATGLAATAADMAWYGWATARLVLSVAAAYGVDIAHPEVRRAYVLGVLAGDEAAVALASQVGASIEMYGQHALTAVNSRLARVIVLRLSTRLATSRALTLIPVGIGAAAGAGVNYVLGRDLAHRTVAMFRSLAAARPPAPVTLSGSAVHRRPLPEALRGTRPQLPATGGSPVPGPGAGPVPAP